MIEIICDQFQIKQKGQNDIEIHKESDYENCIKTIETFLKNEKSLKIFVRNPGIFSWFDHVKKKYGATIDVVDPKKELLKKLNRSNLPAQLSNPDTIIEYKLIDKAVECIISEGESTETWLFRSLLGTVWTYESLHEEFHVQELFQWFFDHDKLHTQLALNLMDQRLENWIAGSIAYSSLIQWIKPQPLKRISYLAWEKMLANYPLKKIMEWFQHEGIWAALIQLPDRDSLPLYLFPPVQLSPVLAHHVRVFLDKTWETDSLQAAVACISGKLDVEIKFLTSRLQLRLQNNLALTHDQYAAIQNASDNHPKVMEIASLLLPATKPDVLSDDADSAAVIKWIKEGYLPFYDSCRMLQKVDDTLDLIESFTRWLKKNYTSLLTSGDAMAYRQTNHLKNRLVENPLLIVVVDGLDFLTARQALLPALFENELYPETDVQPFLSYLPTETFIAKPALVGGKMPDQLADEVPGAPYYKKVALQLFHLKDDDIQAATHKEKSIAELVNKPASLYLYLDNHLDAEYLHAQYNPYIRKQKYAEHVKKMANSLKDAVEITQQLYGKKLLIAILSDHGYTELPKNAQIIPMSAKTKHRSAQIGANESMPSENTWILKSDLFGLKHSMVIATGYACFGSMPKGATHGGCTPQELAVPCITVSSEAYQPLLPIAVSIEGNIHRRRRENPINLSITNPNPHGVTVTSLNFKTIDISRHLPIHIDPGGVKKICLNLDASDIQSSVYEISGEFVIESFAETKTGALHLQVPTFGAMSTEFDDEFDL